MLGKIKESLLKCPDDGSIYLIEKLSDISGFFMVKSHLIYMVTNFEKISHQNLSTEFLRLNTNIEIVSIKNDQQFQSGKYNSLEIVPVENEYSDEHLTSFINLCVAHTTYMKAANFVKFFYSLVSLFQFPKEQEYKNLIGFFGELSFLKYLAEKSECDLSDLWHRSGSNDKYDIVLPKCNIEIKATSSIDELVTIKHSQLFNMDNNFLVSIIVEENSSGITLNELITNMLSDPTYFKGFNFTLNVEKEKRRISPVDAETKRFVFKNAFIYNAAEINPFKIVPDEIYSLSYRMNLQEKPQISIDDFEKELKNV